MIAWWFVNANESNLPSLKSGIGVGVGGRGVTKDTGQLPVLHFIDYRKVPYPSFFLPKHVKFDIQQLRVNVKIGNRNTLCCKLSTVILLVIISWYAKESISVST